MAHLIVREPGRVTFTVELTGRFDIGRSPDSDLVLADLQASHKHARVENAGGRWEIVDLGATHGVRVNQAPRARHLLEDGDVVQIGNVLLVFRAESSPLDVATRDAAPPADPEQRLRVLFDVSRIIGARIDTEELVGRMLETALAVLGCARGVASLSDGISVGGRRIVRPHGDDVVVSRALLDAMLVRRQAVSVAGIQHETLARQGVAAAMGAPLVVGSRVLGFLYVDDRTRPDRFAPDELDFMTALAHLTAAAVAQAEGQQRALSVAEALRAAHPPPELLGDCQPMRALSRQLARFATADAPVLIRGESGTGKELVAGLIHAASPRAEEPFVAVNCAALPDTLLESELFGHEKGAFTGAVKARRGKFALAHRGTLLLDEIGDLSLAAQAKILRVLAGGEVVPLGGEASVRVDVRVLAATHKSLEDEIAAGRFREDLYYRLNVGEVVVPPLRDRGDDVLLLANAFLERAARRAGRRPPALSPSAIEVLRGYAWPGNVRQLQNEMERAFILGNGDVADIDDLRVRRAAVGSTPPLDWAGLQGARKQLDASERAHIVEALRRHGGVVAQAARTLGVPRTTLASRIASLGLGDTSD